MLHSGSRGVGQHIGRCFIDKALERHHKEGHAAPFGMGWLDEGTPEFDDYVQAMTWAQAYAQTNREVLLGLLMQVLSERVGRKVGLIDQVVQCHHNYVVRETWDDEEVWITRKGAVSAREGQRAIVPGSMGTGSFIVEGRGHPDSWCSCAHGADRVMSRLQARQQFTTKDLKRQTLGVECRQDKTILDELPSAYKNIQHVMEDQQDLVKRQPYWKYMKKCSKTV